MRDDLDATRSIHDFKLAVELPSDEPLLSLIWRNHIHHVASFN
jgi:hypothetical protein